MYGNNSNGNGAAWARGFAALWAVLAIGLGLAAFPAEAQPFAYVANGGSDTVSVIDTATHPPSVVATVGVGMSPDGVAVTPNGKHVYVANASSNTVLVIRAATNTVVGLPIKVGVQPIGVAITPDGTQAYVANFHDGTVSVIDTATKMVVADVRVGEWRRGGRLHAGRDTRLCREFYRRYCFGVCQARQHAGDLDSGGDSPQWDRHHSGRDTRLCCE